VHRNRLIPITAEEFDKHQSDGVAALFDHACPKSCGCNRCGFGGFFDARGGARQDIVIVSNDEGSFIRAAEDLVKSKDEVFVGFVEDGQPPEFEDVFEVREV